MRVALHVNHAEHQKTNAGWMAEGLRRHGHETFFVPFDQPTDADMAVVWGWRQKRVELHCRQRNIPLLVMERGHLQPRFVYTSCGFGGIQRKAEYPDITDPARWNEHFSHLFKPWRETGRHALICGQVRGDASIGNLNIERWGNEVTQELIGMGYEVVYRPHPFSIRHSDNFCPAGARLSLEPSLDTDMEHADFVVVYCSTAGVEAALAGVPVVTLNDGAMAWPVASHDLKNPITKPDRSEWMHRLAWMQWTETELRDGSAWNALKTCASIAH